MIDIWFAWVSVLTPIKYEWRLSSALSEIDTEVFSWFPNSRPCRSANREKLASTADKSVFDTNSRLTSTDVSELYCSKLSSPSPSDINTSSPSSLSLVHSRAKVWSTKLTSSLGTNAAGCWQINHLMAVFHRLDCGVRSIFGPLYIKTALYSVNAVGPAISPL